MGKFEKSIQIESIRLVSKVVVNQRFFNSLNLKALARETIYIKLGNSFALDIVCQSP